MIPLDGGYFASTHNLPPDRDGVRWHMVIGPGGGMRGLVGNAHAGFVGDENVIPDGGWTAAAGPAVVTGFKTMRGAVAALLDHPDYPKES